MGLLSSFFKKKISTPSDSVHPNFPKKLPLNLRLTGLVKFKPSSETYFLLNEQKMAVQLPSEDCLIEAISKFDLFGLKIYRAYLDNREPNSVIQVHCDGDKVLDVILFNRKFEFIVENDQGAVQEWRNMVGWKDMNTPDGYTYLRDWSANIDTFGEHVRPVTFSEDYFASESECVGVSNEMMLYKRILEGGTEEDIEYLLIGFRRGLGRYRVEGWTGTVIGTEGVDFL